jgi:hypothetical protein
MGFYQDNLRQCDDPLLNIIRNNYQSVERKKTRKHKHGTFHTLILEL